MTQSIARSDMPASPGGGSSLETGEMKKFELLPPRLIFWLCVVLVTVETLYGFYWAVPNIGVRLGIWPREIDQGLYELIPTLSKLQETLFFSHVVLNVLALAALLRRWAGCIALFVTAFLLDRIDWIMLGLNPIASFQNDTGVAFTHLITLFAGIGLMAILQIGTIGLMTVMLQNGQLTTTLPPELARLFRRR
jgi:hypothetical protein